MEKNLSYDALIRAIEICRTQALLAAACGKKQPHVQKWLNSPKGVPGDYCPLIEAATGGLVTCEELRPDLARNWAILRSSAEKSHATREFAGA
ncbi:helix-turn-helix domain-containing protein [Cupriavidus basilensis]